MKKTESTRAKVKSTNGHRDHKLGERIKVVLGGESSFLIVLDEDDGHTTWQTLRWNNIPLGLEKILDYSQKKNLTIKNVNFAPDGRWFVQVHRDDDDELIDPSFYDSIVDNNMGGDENIEKNFSQSQNAYSWWGDVTQKVNNALMNWTLKPHSLKITFGYRGMCFMQQGDNGHWDCGYTKVEPGLKERFEKRYHDGGKVDFVRIFPFYGYDSSYIISDSQGTKWLGVDESLARELRENAATEQVCDVAVGRNETWVVIYSKRATFSLDFPLNVKAELDQFFKTQMLRGRKKESLIQNYQKKLNDLQGIISREREEKVRREDEKKFQLEEINELKEKLKAASVSNSKTSDSFRVGMRVTVQETSKRLGDAVITELNTGRNGSYFTVRFDDGKIDSRIDPEEIDYFDEDARIEKLEEETETYQHKFLAKRLELNCYRGEIFLWRGLRQNEAQGKLLAPKDVMATSTLESTLIDGSKPSHFLHLTRCPNIAIYYAQYNALDNEKVFIAQIDSSFIGLSSDIYDISTKSGCDRHNIKARNYAISHQVVSVKCSIPHRAITYHEISRLGIPRSLKCSLEEYLHQITEPVAVKVKKWEREALQNILESECERLKFASRTSLIQYPNYIVAIAVARGMVSPIEKEFDPLWKKILSNVPVGNSLPY